MQPKLKPIDENGYCINDKFIQKLHKRLEEDCLAGGDIKTNIALEVYRAAADKLLCAHIVAVFLSEYEIGRKGQ